MSGISVTNSNITTTAVTPPTKPEAATTLAPGQTGNSSNPPYIVDLTVTAVVKSRKLQGQTTEQISSSIGIDAKTVDSHLNAKPAEPAFMTAPAKIPTTPVDSVSSTSASSAVVQPTQSSTSPPTPPASVKSFLKTPDTTPDPVPGSAVANGASGVPAVPAPLAPPASFTSLNNSNSSAQSAAKAIGI